MAETTPLCRACGGSLEGKRRGAKFCGDRCRKRGSRTARKTAASKKPPVDNPASGLVDAVRRELEEANRLDTFAGQLALEIARRMTAVDATGVSGLSKELRQVRAEALDGAELPGGTSGAPAETENEVERARRRREEKAAAAAGATS